MATSVLGKPLQLRWINTYQRPNPLSAQPVVQAQLLHEPIGLSADVVVSALKSLQREIRLSDDWVPTHTAPPVETADLLGDTLTRKALRNLRDDGIFMLLEKFKHGSPDKFRCRELKKNGEFKARYQHGSSIESKKISIVHANHEAPLRRFIGAMAPPAIPQHYTHHPVPLRLLGQVAAAFRAPRAAAFGRDAFSPCPGRKHTSRDQAAGQHRRAGAAPPPATPSRLSGRTH
jgi:hypothetical protein